MSEILDLLGGNIPTYVGVFLGIYEVLARLIPTVKNWSILKVIVQVLEFLFPNIQKNGNGTVMELQATTRKRF